VTWCSAISALPITSRKYQRTHHSLLKIFGLECEWCRAKLQFCCCREFNLFFLVQQTAQIKGFQVVVGRSKLNCGLGQ